MLEYCSEWTGYYPTKVAASACTLTFTALNAILDFVI
jgi:hypothetical protein